ncbi:MULTISPECIES: hypothetical protein [Cetobacterium]|uniref:hypothetical protein n=1 Tax=Cetobacterium TaxID=180162 RepID=UPI00211E8003|nr:hypothetical protein [Cetobacterium somerae]MCQ9627515.1 hypothetical protein [Cetobacterium somerae]
MNKIPKEYEEADKFLNSFKLAYGEIRKLDKCEIEFILKRAQELQVKNVKECIDFIKANKMNKGGR